MSASLVDDLPTLRLSEQAREFGAVAVIALIAAYLVLVAALLHSDSARCDHLRAAHDPRAQQVCQEAGR